MNFLETSGLLGGGAVVAMVGAFAVQFAEVAQQITMEQAAEYSAPAATDPIVDELPQVSRAESSTLQIAAADQLHAIIARNEDALSNREPLTPEQQQVVSYFEKFARNRNAEGGTENNLINFDNLTIHRLDVKYYYTAAELYLDIDVPALLSEQAELVQASICGQAAIRTLIEDYGLGYSYTFISRDFRYIGEVHGDVTRCAS